MKFSLTFLLVFMVSALTFAGTPSFEVEVVGKGTPVIMIPGYSCSGEVWDETANHLKNKHQLHILTLAGFGGAQPIEGAFLQTVRDQLIEYVIAQKLQKPAVIGHSLGAFMALSVASTKPDLFGKIICVDGLPFISAIQDPNITVSSIKDLPHYNMETVIQNFKSLPNEGYVESMTASMLFQVRDTLRAKQIAQWSFASDRATLGRAIVELALTDIRQDIAQIKTPVLILASLFGTAEASQQIYTQQYAALQNKEIKVANSKHFIMYDVPEWFYAEVDAFLSN